MPMKKLAVFLLAATTVFGGTCSPAACATWSSVSTMSDEVLACHSVNMQRHDAANICYDAVFPGIAS